VEFPQVTNRILLVLPPHPLSLSAKTALEPITEFLKKAVIGQRWREAALKAHALDLCELERTDKGIQSDFLLEDCRNPLAGKVSAAMPAARDLQLDRVGLVLGCWLLSGSIIDSPIPIRSLLCADNQRCVAYCATRLQLSAVRLTRE
jgi:hypothetical protein